MGITDRVLDRLKTSIQLTERVTGLAGRMERLSVEVRDIDRRLVRVETALELTSGNRFKPLSPPKDTEA